MNGKIIGKTPPIGTAGHQETNGNLSAMRAGLPTGFPPVWRQPRVELHIRLTTGQHRTRSGLRPPPRLVCRRTGSNRNDPKSVFTCDFGSPQTLLGSGEKAIPAAITTRRDFRVGITKILLEICPGFFTVFCLYGLEPLEQQVVTKTESGVRAKRRCILQSRGRIKEPILRVRSITFISYNLLTESLL